MGRCLTTLLSLLVLSGCATSADLTVSYSGITFHIPGNVVAVGSAGGDDNFLGFKYSKETGERYIAFTRESGIGTGGCDYTTFFREVLALTDGNNCESSAVESFRTVFDVGNDADVWEGDQHDVYYFPGDDGKVFAFLVLGDDRVVKIDSDSLDENSLRGILRNQLEGEAS